MNKLLEQLQLLCGQQSHLEKAFEDSIDDEAFARAPIGVSMLNELLLTAGFDTVSDAFFSLLCNGIPKPYTHSLTINGIDDLRMNVETFRKISALKYGNFKFAFKRWSSMTTEQLRNELSDVLDVTQDRKEWFTTRTEPIDEIEDINIEDAPFLGYLSGRPDTSLTDSEKKRRSDALAIGQRNFRKYLTFNHMDVYIATSMRIYRDYTSVRNLIERVFKDPFVRELKLRYFDPTQVYSEEVLSKSLLESLMLKRAKCAIYCAQEKETLGKDAELATTLAQGKPVIVYLPHIDDLNRYKEEIIQDGRKGNPENPIEVAKHYLISDFPDYVMNNFDFFRDANLDNVTNELAKLYSDHYDKRAQMLTEAHPLSMQVNLQTGVATGILLARKEDDCARLLYAIMCKRLDFVLIEEKPKYPDLACGDYQVNYILREKTTNSPYRIVIGNALLTNSFWNFYLKDIR